MIERTPVTVLEASSEEKRALLERLLRQALMPASQPLTLIGEEDRRRLPEDVEDAYPLTMLQTGMLFHTESAPETSVYHDIFRRHLRCPFDEGVFREAAGRLAARHPVLRSSFHLSSYSEPLQLVHRQVEIPIELYDLTDLPKADQEKALSDWMEAERRRGFDWRKAPLLRLAVHRRSPGTFEFFQSFHHAILDGWSVAALNAELFQIYFALLGEDAPPLPEPPAVAFRDYVALEREALAADEQRQFWIDRLAGAEPARLPRWPGVEAAALRRLAARPVAIPRETGERLKALARGLGVPVKSVLLAAHLAVLRLLTGNEDIISGVVSNGRPEQVDGERVIGLFLNSLPFRLDLPGGTWSELVQKTFAADRELLSYRRLPLAVIQNAVGGESPFDVLFTFVNFHVYRGLARLRGFQELGGMGVTETNYDFQAFFAEDPFEGFLTLRLDYNPDVFPEPQIVAIGGYYATILEQISRDPNGRYELFSPLSEEERTRVLRDWNETGAVVPRERCLHELIEEQAARQPETPAVLYRDQEVTFAELNRRANRLAHHLRSLGVGPDTIVGLCAERSIEMVTGVLAILKAGGAYLYLDPAYPRDRLALVADEARLPVILTQEPLRDLWSSGRSRLVPLEPPGGDLPETDPESRASAQSLAYAIYTSGSTGTPKGILIQHGSVLNLLEGLFRTLYRDLPQRPLRVSLNGSLAFDTSVKQLVQLAHGHTLCVVPEDERFDGRGLLEWLRRSEVDVFDCTPSQLRLLLQSGLASEAREGRLTILVGGEAVDRKLWDALAEAPHLDAFNVYGPAECTVDATVHRILDSPAGPVLGRPINNVRIYVVDRQDQPLPIGVPGEIRIGGDGLARGYFGRPDLTAERFVPDPFGTDPGARLYRTGDRGRWLPSGDLEFLGRIDHQVKIRGHRIEPGEIETVLRRHPAVREVAVVAQQDPAGDHRLAAFLVPAAGDPPSTDEVISFLSSRLPAYMVPSFFGILEALPMLPNGKVDRRALAAAGREATTADDRYVAPSTPLEEALAAIWAETLRLDRVGLHDNFFAIGGHSLLAIQLIIKIRERIGIDLPLRSLLEEPSVAGIAYELARLQAEAAEEGDLAELLGEIEGMSEEDLEKSLEEQSQDGAVR